MTEAQEKRLEELRRKHLEEIHKRKVEEEHLKQLRQVERKRAEELERKKARKSSQALLTDSILQEIDSTLKRGKNRPFLIIVAGLIIVVLLGNFFLSRGHDLPYYLDQIKPGMSYDEVSNIAPPVLVVKKRAPIEKNRSISIFAYFVEPDVHVASYMHLGYRGLFPKRDYAYIYFDERGKVVGIEFSFEKGGWSPSWGTSQWNRKNNNAKK
jgi:hypothetical protein